MESPSAPNMKLNHSSSRQRQNYEGNELLNVPLEIYKHVHNRQIGRFSPFPRNAISEYVSQYLPGIYMERQFKLGKINKIFAAQWISDKQVVFGTKCNKLQVIDTINERMIHIPSLKSSTHSEAARCPCGIHSVAINPSRTLLATGGENTNDLAVYRLPTFDPVCVGEGGHTDWIFDINWLDDEFVVSGSRDSKICLWRVRNNGRSASACAVNLPSHSFLTPTASLHCKKAEKVRALAFNQKTRGLASLSLNAYLHLIDVKTFQQVSSKRLTQTGENVCMSLGEHHNLYAIGSQSHVTFVDARDFRKSRIIDSKQRGAGIRSVSFKENIVTIGTGAGFVYFYDIRKKGYLELNCGHLRALQMGKGWLHHDEMYRNYFMHHEYPNAIYTHCYDEYGGRLFTAGGPLPAGLWGNYAGVWQ